MNNIKIKKVLILGSGALKIGQAGEFDYSGSQAIKALKEDNIYTVLINPNIATVQTNKDFADEVYFLPVKPEFVEQVIIKEKVDALLLSFGGQTALNCGLELEKQGILKKHNVKVLGTLISVIRDTEDRELFKEKLNQINVNTAKSIASYNTNATLKAAKEIGFPVMLRAGFSLGGMGSKVVYNESECLAIANKIFVKSSQILVEECLTGWKEIEYEVVRDNNDNCITVCNMENLDPMGVHTGDSIVVAPSQTLDDYDYNYLRTTAIKTIRHLGIIGECNIQYAYNPNKREYRVIEVNARLSRSSALASKATGYPLAYVAAKIAIGYNLDEIKNSVTKTTTAFFEPALDYIACKFPRWDLDKFPGVDKTLGSEMKSVGEVMALGRNFNEAFQKALRMLDLGYLGVEPEKFNFDDIEDALIKPNQLRIFAIAKSFYDGYSVDKVHDLTKIDKFFLYNIYELVNKYKKIKQAKKLDNIDSDFLYDLKSNGFSDKFLANILNTSETEVRNYRKELNIRPKISQIDTLAAEYPAQTNFLYYSYSRIENDVSNKELENAIIVLGSGCYRIGSSVEFDWCNVSAVNTARKLGYKTIVLNSNPETVSTDYDNSDFLIFDEISLEIIDEIYTYGLAKGVVISFGGQTPNNLALDLYNSNINILGTSAINIDRAEDRNKFSKLLDSENISQPKWVSVDNYNLLENIDNALGGYPLLVRPSYVLSGRAMKVAYNKEDLFDFVKDASLVSEKYPVIISKFEKNAKEIELDAVAIDGQLKVHAISEHIEDAGTHSGDATLVINTLTVPKEIELEIINIAHKLSKNLSITGPFNVQFLYKNNELKIIECNLRASRSFPFISKALNINFIDVAMQGILGKDNFKFDSNFNNIPYKVVKAPKFSFERLKGSDPKLGVEMLSTGEVGCFAKTYHEALLLAYLSVDFEIPKKGVLLSITREDYDKNKLISLISFIKNKTNLKLFINKESLNYIKVEIVDEQIISDSKKIIADRNVDMVIAIGDDIESEIRKCSIDYNIPLFTELNLALNIVTSCFGNTLEICSSREILHAD